MNHPETGHKHSHEKDCTCDHDHDHESSSLSLAGRWMVSIVIIGTLLFLLRPFIISQMIVRVTSYSSSSLYNDAIRICKKIIAIDKDNKQAWTSLGFAYMDISRVDLATAAFEKVIVLYPQDKGAASFELGQAYYLKGEYAQAIENFERVREAGPRAGALLDADILKYRHGTLGFRSINSMQTLLSQLQKSYQQTGNTTKAAEIQTEYDLYKNKHSRVLF